MIPLRERLRSNKDQMLKDLTAFIQHETPSDDPAALAAGLAWLRDLVVRRIGTPCEETIVDGGNYGDTAILDFEASGGGYGHITILCHYDTVWPLGTLAEWPVAITEDRMTGPGAFDMKAGLVQALWAIAIAREVGFPIPAIRLVLNGDEEIGSIGSRPVIERAVQGTDAVLVFEASAGGALKTGRKGIGLFGITTRGIEAHSGLDPENGVSAIDEMARAVLRLHAAADHTSGTSVNVGTINGGSRANVTAGAAVATVDVRVSEEAEMERIEAVLGSLVSHHSQARLEVNGAWNRPIMSRSEGTAELFRLAQEAATELGMSIAEVSVGGASDGNYAAALGIPVLDGLGAVGDGAHARHEWISIDGMLERTALTAVLLRLLSERESNAALPMHQASSIS